MRGALLALVTVFVAVHGPAAPAQDDFPKPRSPAESLRCLKPRAGFEVELVAAEPLVQDPVAFAWGPDGKFWVVEMGDYPLGIDGKGKHGGRVKFLEDTDGDGKYDRATVFLDQLGYPTGVMPWRKGVLVACAPEIFYAEDTDGDGKADRRATLYAGFVEGNQQHRVNGLVWGLDNWIYCANGDSGGQVKSTKTGASVDIRGRDFRIRPDEGAIDAQSGQTQFGRCQDDWGNWFGCNNSNPMWHFALADHYLRRNQNLFAPSPRIPVSVTPGAAPVFPLSRTLPRFNDPRMANHFTSACSVMVYRDELFGSDFAGNAFISEPVHNLIHREVMTAEGVTFRSRRAGDEQQSEFLASTDHWFRPTMIQTGPDGALWVADMYRLVIEHPQWIPKEWQQKLDLRAGHDLGRIYRVYPTGRKPRAVPRFDRLDTAGLVAALDSPNGWQRDMAQMLLIQRHDPAAIPLLEKQAAAHTQPLCRLHALCTLDGLAALRPPVLLRTLSDAHAGVRRHAIRLSEGRFAKAPELGSALGRLAADPDAQVRMQLAYTLGEWDDPRAGQMLGQLAIGAGNDRYLLAAVLSSVSKRNLDAMLLAVLAIDPGSRPSAALVESLLWQASSIGHGKALVTLLKAVATPEKGQYASWQLAALAGLLDLLDQRKTPLTTLRSEGDAELKAVLGQLTGLFEAARKTVANPKAPAEERLLAIRLLGRGLDRQAEDRQVLARLLVPQVPEPEQAAAVAGLGRLSDREVPALLLAGWKSHGPNLRAQLLDVLLSREAWVQAALDAIEKEQVLAAEVDAARRQRLLEHKNPVIRERAGKLFASSLNPDRQKVLEAYRSALTLKPDPKRGQQLFLKNCATCHKLGDAGHTVGPELASVGDKSPEGLLIAVLDPNRAVEARYVNYTALTKNGLTYTGLLAGETGNSVTLLAPEGKQQVVLRTDLEELTSNGRSTMPEGLEKDLKPQDLADLIAYVRAGLPQLQRKVFPGNQPELVRPGTDGTLQLRASNCEIYGPSIVLEKQYGNIGWWSSGDDHVIWTVEVPRAGKYAVWLDWACIDSQAGKGFVLQAGLHRLTNKVQGTGSWDNYRQAHVGDILLEAGPQRVVFRSASGVAGSLIDLRGIKLVPAAAK